MLQQSHIVWDKNSPFKSWNKATLNAGKVPQKFDQLLSTKNETLVMF